MFFRNGIYDALGRMSGGTLTSGGNALYTFTSVWKGTQLQNSYDKVLGQTSTYTYDGFNRLLSRTANSVQDYTWTYDRYGNRWTQNGAGQNFNTATNRLSTGGYTYDAAGNMTYDSFNHYTYTYDAEGNITAVTGNTTATYVYNALNQRVSSKVGTGAATEFVFNANGQRVSEWNGTTHLQLKGKYYWGGQPLAYYTTASSGSAGAHFEHTDWLGTERLRTTYNSGGNPQYAQEGSYTSLPWGDAQTPATNGSDAAHYAQLDHDAETNTDHADFRQYSNAQGRWLSPDPYDGSYDTSNPQSMNRYVYAMNNPLSNVDPSGNAPCTWSTEDGLTCPEWEYDASYGGPPPTPSEFQKSLSGVINCDENPDLPECIAAANDPANNGTQNQTCLAANIAQINSVSDLNVSPSNLANPPYMFDGGMNFDFSVPGASPSDLAAGRYPSSTFNFITGIGHSLHVTSPGGVDPSTYGIGPGDAFTFTTHIDSAYSTWHTPIGAFIHWFVDVRDNGAHRGLC